VSTSIKELTLVPCHTLEDRNVNIPGGGENRGVSLLAALMPTEDFTLSDVDGNTVDSSC